MRRSGQHLHIRVHRKFALEDVAEFHCEHSLAKEGPSVQCLNNLLAVVHHLNTTFADEKYPLMSKHFFVNGLVPPVGLSVLTSSCMTFEWHLASNLRVVKFLKNINDGSESGKRVYLGITGGRGLWVLFWVL